jgi:hypothetical protein
MTDIPMRYVATDNTRAASQSAARNIQQVGKAASTANSQVSGASKAMQSALSSVGGEVGKVSASFGGFSAGAIAMTGAIGAVTAGIVTLGSSLATMANEYVAFDAIKSSLDTLANSVGASGDQIVSSLQKASSGLIAQKDLALAANRAILFGVADTAEEMGQLMEVAIARGRAMGLSATQAFGDLVTGLGRISPMILDNLGIVTGGEAAFDAYAESIGKTVDQLTDAEKKQFLLNKVISSSKDIVASTAGAQVNAAEQMGAAWTDLRVVIGELASPAVSAGLQALTGALRSVADAAADAGAPATIETFSTEIEELRAQIMLLKQSGLTEEDFAIVNLRSQIAAIREVRLEMEKQITAQQRMNDFQQASVNTGWIERLREQARAIRQEMVPLQALLQAPNLLDFERAGAESQLGEMQARLDEVNRLLAGTTAQVQEGGYAWQAYANSIAPAASAVGVAAQAEAEFAAALEQSNAARAAAVQGAVELDAAFQSLAQGAVNSMISEMGGAAIQHLIELRNVAAETYAFWINETNNAAFAQAMAGDAVDALTAKLIAQHEAYVGVAGGIAIATNATSTFASWLGVAEGAAIGLNSQLINLANTAAGVAFGIAQIGDVPGMRRGGRSGSNADIVRSMNLPRMPVYKAPSMNVGAYGKLREDRGAAGLSSMYDDMQKASGGMGKLGSAAKAAAEGVKDLESALKGIPGLFGTSDVTQEQLDLAEKGVPQNFADNYLRRLRDEITNGKDWEGVSVEDAAAALGLDGALAAEEVLRQFEAAWQNQSLFANPENLKFIDMAAVQAAIQQQTASADGEKNLKALFGIGSDEDVAAVAALGLEIQSGLASWLSENGFGDAGANLASALGAGVKEGSAELGNGVSGGLNDWVGSKEGQGQITDFAERLSSEISGRMKITPPLDLPPASGNTGSTPPTIPEGGAKANATGVTINVNSQVDATRVATQVAKRFKK